MTGPVRCRLLSPAHYRHAGKLTFPRQKRMEFQCRGKYLNIGVFHLSRRFQTRAVPEPAARFFPAIVRRPVGMRGKGQFHAGHTSSYRRHLASLFDGIQPLGSALTPKFNGGRPERLQDSPVSTLAKSFVWGGRCLYHQIVKRFIREFHSSSLCSVK